MSGSALHTLVTGANGFIGRRLTARLLDAGANVRAFVLPGEPVPASWTDRVEIVRGDITDASAVDAATQGRDVLFHLAAVVGDAGSDALHQHVTVGGSQNVYRAALEHDARVVLTSSVVVYGDRIGRDVCHEDHPMGRLQGPYSRAKQAQERNAFELHATRGLKLAVVRPTNVYGAGSGPWVRDLGEQIRKGLPCLVGDGSQNAGLVHVDNLVNLLLLAGTREEALGRVYNGCDGLDVSWRDYTSDLARILSAPSPRAMPVPVAHALARLTEATWKRLPARWTRGRRPPVTAEAINLVGSNHRVPNDRARTELGWTPTVNYNQAIAEIASHLRESLL